MVDSYTRWYREGTVTVAINSVTVQGANTHWLSSGINPGDIFYCGTPCIPYEVDNVVSDTVIKLKTPFLGSSGSGQNYMVIRNFTATLPSRLTAQVSNLLGLFSRYIDDDITRFTGPDAYQVAVRNGYTGTEAEWLESLKAAGEIAALMARTEPLSYTGAGAHNCLCVEKNLGSSYTAEQAAAIAANTFKGLYVGSYWSFSNVPYTYYERTADTAAQSGKTYYADAKGTALETQPETGADISDAGYFELKNATYTGNMRIADCNYFLKSGDTACDTPHLIIVPDANLYSHRMNDTNTTEGAYAGSKMRTEGLERAKAIFLACFGAGTLLSHRLYLQNAVTDGIPSAGAWTDSDGCELLTEQMAYGGLIFNSGSRAGSAIEVSGNRYTIGCKQLNLFRHRPDLISNRQWFWLQDVVSAAYFAYVGRAGDAYANSASISGGVRPVFALRKAA